MADAPAPTRPVRVHVLPAIAAWILPGLGHVLIGETRRGIILGATIGMLWLGGLTMGGVGVFDRQANRIGGLGQMLVGPSLAMDYYHQRIEQRFIAGGLHPDRQPFYEPPLGRMQEQGVLYTAMAGLLNLLVIIDVVYRSGDDPQP